jgi:hypothetical protein
MNSHTAANATFSMNRWTKLLVLHWSVNHKRYLLAMPAMLGLLLVWEGFIVIINTYQPLDEGFQGLTYCVGLYTVGCLYASTIFAEFDNKARGIAWLAVPSSALEKLLCGWLYSAITFFVVYTMAFYLVDIPMIRIVNGLIEYGHRTWTGGLPIEPVRVFNVFKGLPNDYLRHSGSLYLLFYFALQSAFALGSVYFNRYAFIKTGVAIAIALICFMTLQQRLIDSALPPGWHRQFFYDWITDTGTLHVRAVRLSPFLSAILGSLLLYGIPVIFWTATYFRIKEKEV